MLWCLQPNLLKTIEIIDLDNNKYTVANKLSGVTKQAFPEEIIRQLMCSNLILNFDISKENIVLEFPIQMGSTKKRADIVVLDDENQPYIIIEVKVKIAKSGRKQLFSYLQATPAKLGILVDSNEILFFNKNYDLKIIEVESLQLDYETVEEPIDNNYLGITRLIKDSYPNGVIEWFVEVKNKTFKISLKDIQDYSKIQTYALDVGESLLNYNPSKNEWKSVLHMLIVNAKEKNSGARVKDCAEYSFFSDIMIMFKIDNMNIEKYFSVRRDGTLCFWFNGVYSNYFNFKKQRKEKPISKKTIILFFQLHKILLEKSVTCRICDKSIRSNIIDLSKLPKEFKIFLNKKLSSKFLL